jgi:hypothetical protein
MSEARVACPRCGQDWLSEVRLVNLGRLGVWCKECDALWVGTEPLDDNFEDYGTYMKQYGRPEPEGPGEIEVLGIYERTAWDS